MALRTERPAWKILQMASAAVCIVLRVIDFTDRAKSPGEVESAGLRSAYVPFSECSEHSVIREAWKNYITSKERWLVLAAIGYCTPHLN